MKQPHAHTPRPPLEPQIAQPPKLPSDNHQVHVWLMFTDNLQVPHQLNSNRLLSEQEVQRQQRFVTPELQYRYQCRREMLRRTLTLYRPDTRASEWIFSQNAHGKPQINPHKAGTICSSTYPIPKGLLCWLFQPLKNVAST